MLKKLTLSLLLTGLLALPLASCNTLEGLGKDTHAAGDAITGAAEKSKNY